MSSFLDKVEKGLYDYEFEPVPLDKRRSVLNLTLVWAGFALSSSLIAVAGGVGIGHDILTATLITFGGYAFMALFAILVGYIGAKHGLTTPMVMKWSLGEKGSNVIYLVIICFLKTGWYAFNCGFLGLLLATYLTRGQYESLWALAFGLIVLSSAVFGFKGLLAISAVAVPALVVLFLLLVNASLGQTTLTQIIAAPAAVPTSISLTLWMVMGYYADGVITTSDITRYAKKPLRDTILSTTIGFFILPPVLFFASFVVFHSTGHWGDPVGAIASLGYLPLALIVIGLMGWTTIDNDAYAMGLTLSQATGKPKWMWTLIMGVVATFLAVVASPFYWIKPWLLILGAVFFPLIGVMVTDFYILKKGSYNESNMPKGFVPSTFVAVPVAAIASVYLERIGFGPAPLWGVIIAGAILLVLNNTSLGRGTEDRIKEIKSHSSSTSN